MTTRHASAIPNNLMLDMPTSPTIIRCGTSNCPGKEVPEKVGRWQIVAWSNSTTTDHHSGYNVLDIPPAPSPGHRHYSDSIVNKHARLLQGNRSPVWVDWLGVATHVTKRYDFSGCCYGYAVAILDGDELVHNAVSHFLACSRLYRLFGPIYLRKTIDYGSLRLSFS